MRQSRCKSPKTHGKGHTAGVSGEFWGAHWSFEELARDLLKHLGSDLGVTWMPLGLVWFNSLWKNTILRFRCCSAAECLLLQVWAAKLKPLGASNRMRTVPCCPQVSIPRGKDYNNSETHENAIQMTRTLSRSGYCGGGCWRVCGQG